MRSAPKKWWTLAARVNGTVYIRLTRPKTPIIYEAHETFAIGKSHVLKKTARDRAAVVAAGITVHEALKAARMLEEEGISIRVIDAYSVKPLDEETIGQAADETGCLITVEDHYPEGGLGESVLNVLAGRKVTFRKLAVNGLRRSGDPETLMEHYGISSSKIVAAVKEATQIGG